MIFQGEIVMVTQGQGDIHEIGEDVQQLIAKSGIKSGVAHVFNVGSTGAITTIEFEPGLQKDLPSLLNRLIPPSRSYQHERTWRDGNAHSHLQASLLGASLTVPVRQGKAVLGTWQQIVHVECDVKPRQREIVITVVGE